MITYTIAMPQPQTHLYEVSVTIEGLNGSATDFVLPTWTPGSYMIREFARHVQDFAAFARSAEGSLHERLPWSKTAKHTWRVEHPASSQVTVFYRVYAYELTVRTSHLDDSHGYFNGANVFMYVPGRTAEPLTLHVVTPEHWVVTTGLERAETQVTLAGDGHAAEQSSPSAFVLRPSSFIAQDYDELVDCPVECGTQRLLTFDVDGIEHRIALWGHGNEDEARLVGDTKRIVEVQRDFFGGLPYKHYTFLIHLTDGRGGGLEHRNSVSNMLDRWVFRPETSYERFLSLQSHEFFHVWNVKRIRPAALGPFDYSSENYTRLLWAMEGITSYYDELLLVRAGLIRPARYLEKLADEIVILQNQPGRALQSLEQSSFDAWIKFYRPDENSENSSISYYLKGSLVALLLDMEIRRHTDGARSLDDVMRYLFTTYPITGPGIAEDGAFLAAVETVAGSADGAYRAFFARYIAGTDELDYARGLANVGVTLEWRHKDARNGATPAWLGLKTRTENGRTIVASVRADGPAYALGVSAGDELLALDGFRIDEARLHARLAERKPGDTVTLTLFRRDELRQLQLTLVAAPYDALRLVRLEQPDALQERNYRHWMGSDG